MCFTYLKWTNTQYINILHNKYLFYYQSKMRKPRGSVVQKMALLVFPPPT
jgi:hypothetical protein